MKSSSRLVLYSIFRIGLFAVALVAMLLLGLEVWLAAIVAAVMAFCVSYIFFREPRDAVVRDLYERRNGPVVDEDADAENAALDGDGRDQGAVRLEDDRRSQPQPE